MVPAFVVLIMMVYFNDSGPLATQWKECLMTIYITLVILVWVVSIYAREVRGLLRRLSAGLRLPQSWSPVELVTLQFRIGITICASLLFLYTIWFVDGCTRTPFYGETEKERLRNCNWEALSLRGLYRSRPMKP